MYDIGRKRTILAPVHDEHKLVNKVKSNIRTHPPHPENPNLKNQGHKVHLSLSN